MSKLLQQLLQRKLQIFQYVMKICNSVTVDLHGFRVRIIFEWADFSARRYMFMKKGCYSVTKFPYCLEINKLWCNSLKIISVTSGFEVLQKVISVNGWRRWDV